jgi:hypothetical protein
MHNSSAWGKTKMKRGEDYKSDLLADLRNDPEYAAQYLAAAKADSAEAFLCSPSERGCGSEGHSRMSEVLRWQWKSATFAG